MSVYRFLLYLLPKSRREQHGEQMAMAFSELSDSARGPFARTWLWIREVLGLLRFSWRERVSRDLNNGANGHAGWSAELRWAWRGIRARGGKGVLVVFLLAVALAANTVVFSAADSFVFRRTPFRGGDRLASIVETGPAGPSASIRPETIPAWRQQSDLFETVEGYTGGRMYLNGGGEPRIVDYAEITPHLMAALGAAPKWGRGFTDFDIAPGQAPVAIISEEVARKEFGDPARAVGHTLVSPRVSPLVVGVMGASFRFPTNGTGVWRPLDAVNYNKGARFPSTIASLGWLAAGQTLESASKISAVRKPAIDAGLGEAPRKYLWPVSVQPIDPARVDPRIRTTFRLLAGAALSLLLVACMNVISLQLAAVVGRTRTYAVQIALGASRATVVRGALLEGAIMLAAAVAIAAAVTFAATSYIAAALPTATTDSLTNRIDLDGRAVTFMALMAAVTWLLASLPVALSAGQTNVLESLKIDSRTQSGSAGSARLRRWLTMAEVAITVLLLAASAFGVRNYNALIHLSKGFDSNRLMYVIVEPRPLSSDNRADVQERVLAALRSRTDVEAVSVIEAPPPGTGSAITATLVVDGGDVAGPMITLGEFSVDSDYFKTMQIPFRSGRNFASGEPANSAIVDEEFAKKYWPDQDPLGHRFAFKGPSFGNFKDMVIVGVSGHVRLRDDSPIKPSEKFFAIHLPRDNYVTLGYAVRLSDASEAGSLLSMVRSKAPTARVRVIPVDDLYARQYGNELLAASIMTTFGVVAFLVAMAGVYAVMAFLVASRTREIGVRMALGANASSIRRLVLDAAMRPVLLGTLTGILMAIAAAQWAQAQLYGVNAADPWLYAQIASVVVATAILATWQPTRTAIKVDPSTLLRE